MTTKIAPCYSCKHLVSIDNKYSCDAYNEIPKEILIGNVIHNVSYKNDNGVIYEEDINRQNKRWITEELINKRNKFIDSKKRT